MQSRQPFSPRGWGLKEVLVLVVLMGVLLYTLPIALRKMLDHGAVAEMRQSAIYAGRSLQYHWSGLDESQKQQVTRQEMLTLLENSQYQLAAGIQFVEDSYGPESHFNLMHERFGDRVFRFTYNGERITD